MSNPPWLRHLPKGWKASRLKPVVNLRTTRVNSGSSDENYIGLEAIEPWTGRLLKSDIHPSTPDDENENKNVSSSFDPGDVLFGKLRPYLAKGHLAREAGVCTTELLVMTPRKNLDGKFLLNALLTREFIDRVDAETFGTKMPRADWDTIGNLFIPLPPLPEQRAIADYLDHETSTIDALIAEKEHLLSLLAEKRRALITQAVTRGLNTNVPMRDSGVEWLGEIPRHWEVERLRYLASEPFMYGANEAALETDPSFPRFVRITDISEDGSLRSETFKSLPSEIAEPYLLREGDVLLARSGATVGKTLIYRKEWGKACFAGYLIRLRCNRDLLLPDFLFAFTQSHIYWSQIRGGTIQATIQNFSAEKYGEILLPLPPPTEQHSIVVYLDGETAKIDELSSTVKKNVKLLQERRAALISAVVTGQVHV